jgi:hypothetical protein
MALQEWVIGKVLDKSFNSSVSLGRKMLSKWQSPDQVDNWIARLNAYFDGEVKIFCQIKREPEIHMDGLFSLTEAQKAVAVGHCLRLTSLMRPNDPHAILVGEPIWQSDPVHLDAKHVDFAGVCALRDEGLKPEILSSSALIISSDSQEVILHRRAPDVATYPGSLHTLGGAFMPPNTGGVDADRLSLTSTVQREIHEETQVSLITENFPPMMMAKELKSGFIQLVFLGFNISTAAAGRLKENWEGNIVRVPFSKLPTILRDTTWVPTGKSHVLAWLALGAPGTKRKTKFGDLSASQLFNSVVND